MLAEICAACHGVGGRVSQLNPSRIIDRCAQCGGTGEIESGDD